MVHLLMSYILKSSNSMHKSVEQFSVETLEIGGLGAALRALRLPFGKECRSAVSFKGNSFTPTFVGEDPGWYFGRRTESTVLAAEKDVKLLTTLIKRGDEHAKVLRGVMVWCEINAPIYFWKEMDTYRVGAERLSSESSMHIEGKGLSEEKLVEMQETMPMGHMQRRVWMFSYQTLRRIYFQRRNHRLPQWRVFCDWIKTLPFAEEFITVE